MVFVLTRRGLVQYPQGAVSPGAARHSRPLRDWSETVFSGGGEGRQGQGQGALRGQPPSHAMGAPGGGGRAPGADGGGGGGGGSAHGGGRGVVVARRGGSSFGGIVGRWGRESFAPSTRD